MKKKQISITLGIMCVILTVAISIQLKTIWNANTAVSQSFEENGLRDEVLKWKEKYDNTYEQLVKQEEELEQVRKKATENNTTLTAKQDEIRKNNILLGLTNVTGSGMIITLEDNTSLAKEGTGAIINYNDIVVHYGDLLEVVNSLKNADAEAISINDQRLVSTSSITCEGTVIKVNGQKITSPFTIKAIGSQELFNGSLMMPGQYIDILKSDGVIVNVEKSDNITIDKYNGVINFTYTNNKK